MRFTPELHSTLEARFLGVTVLAGASRAQALRFLPWARTLRLRSAIGSWKFGVPQGDLTPDCSREIDLARDAGALLERLNRLRCAGQMSAGTRARLAAASPEMGVTSTSNARARRGRVAHADIRCRSDAGRMSTTDMTRRAFLKRAAAIRGAVTVQREALDGTLLAPTQALPGAAQAVLAQRPGVGLADQRNGRRNPGLRRASG